MPVICERLGRDALGDAEVDDLGLEPAARRLAEHDVVGREVAVDDALRVDLRQTREDLPRDVEGARRAAAARGGASQSSSVTPSMNSQTM